jgi:hypothetical protein
MATAIDPFVVMGAQLMAGLGLSGADGSHGSLGEEEARAFLVRAVEDLPQQEKMLVKMRYYSQMDMNKIGVVLGMTEDRASQLHAKAILGLRVRLERASRTGAMGAYADGYAQTPPGSGAYDLPSTGGGQAAAQVQPPSEHDQQHSAYDRRLDEYGQHSSENGRQAHARSGAQNPRLHGLSPEKLTQVLSNHFDNGLRLGSGIEMERFRRFAADVEGLGGLVALLGADALREALEACGTYFDGKVYAVSERVKALSGEDARQVHACGDAQVQRDTQDHRLRGLSPEKLTHVLSTRFDNGILVSSGIELDRFRRFAAGAEGLDGLAGLSDGELRGAIEACGTYFNGKVYAISARVKDRLAELVGSYFATGAQVIFYEEFYEKNRKWLFRSSVASPEMLMEILEELSLAQYYKPEYFGRTHAPVLVAVGEEILRVWGDGALATYGQLAERLPYVPLERIKNALSHSRDFIRDSEGTYTHYGKVSISPEDREAIRERAATACDDEEKGYASFAELPMGDIEALNPGLSMQALHDAIYRKCLSDGFARQGKIVTREGSPLDALKIMKGHFGVLDRCTVGEMEAYWLELIGNVPNKDTILSVGQDVFVRTDRDNLVAGRFLGFDAGAIDDAIDQFVMGDYLPLKAFTTFGAFPDCGRPWNLFLLESYCRRFSKNYRFDCRSANSRNAGVVIRKSCGMAYKEIMADAVAKAGIALRPNDVNRFLYEYGYIGKSTTSSVGNVIGRAAALRGRSD